MPTHTPLSDHNPYRELGYEEPDEMLARSHLMLDIVANLHRLHWDLPATLALLQIDRDRYHDLMGGRVRRFTRDELSGILDRVVVAQDTSTTASNAVLLNSNWLVAIRHWLTAMVPPLENESELAIAYRGKTPPQPRSASEDDTGDMATGDLAIALDALRDSRYQWLPTLLRGVGSEIELFLQRREPAAPPDPSPPEVMVMLMGHPANIVGRVYSPENHALAVRVSGELPNTDYRIAITPTDRGQLTVRIEAP